MKRLFLSACVLLLALTAWSQSDDRSPDNILRFADWLALQGEYGRAVGEYQRWLFVTGRTTDVILRKVGHAQFLAGDWRAAAAGYDRLVREFPASPLVEEAYYEAAQCFFRLEDWTGLAARIGQYAAAGGTEPRFLLLDGAGLLVQGLYGGALERLEKYLVTVPEAERQEIERLRVLAIQGRDLQGKSPVLAGILSGFVPGLGKIYAGRAADGIFSFLLVGFLGGMAALDFSTQGVASVPAWIYASLGGLFYLGDIWGSVVAANDYTESERQRMAREVKARVQLLFP